MKRLVMWLAMWAGSFGPAFGIATAQPILPPHDAAGAWSYVCENFDYDCTDLQPPAIEWVDILFSGNGNPAYGGYNGTDAILLSTYMLRVADPVFTDSVLAHEMAHYIDVQRGLTVLPFTQENVCASELRAWRVGNAYVLVHGRPDLVDYSWFERYGCFQ